MTDNKVTITICLGSACFARGNNHTRKAIEDYIRENGLNGVVVFKGARCFDNCQNGPVLKINDTFYENVTENKVTEILDKVMSGD
jgi:NADH:ubiquinone oxidoreductase subunit E